MRPGVGTGSIQNKQEVFMIAWINLCVLVVSTVLTLYFYVKSASPAALEKRIGEQAYARCTRYRWGVPQKLYQFDVYFV